MELKEVFADVVVGGSPPRRCLLLPLTPVRDGGGNGGGIVDVAVDGN